MKNLILLVTLLGSISAVGQSWEKLGPEVDSVINPQSGSFLKGTDIAIASDGTVYVAYIDPTEGSGNQGITVKKFNGSSWELMGVERFTNQANNNIPNLGNFDLKLDSYDKPYVALANNNSNNETVLEVWKLNGFTWEQIGSNPSEGGVNNVSMVLINDTVYCSYQDHFNGDKVSVVGYYGGTWQYIGGAGISSGISGNNQLQTYNDTLYIAYGDSDSSGIVVQKYDGTEWIPVTATASISVPSRGPMFTISPVQEYYLIGSDLGDVYFNKYDGANWQGSVTTGNYGTCGGIGVDGMGNTHVLVNDNSIGLVCRSYNNGGWSTTGTAGFATASSSYNTSFHVEEFQKYYVVLAHAVVGYGAIQVYSYDLSASNNEIKVGDLMIYPNPACDLITIETVGLKAVKVINLSGKVVLNSNEATVNISSLPEGAYILQVETDKGIEYSKFVKD